MSRDMEERTKTAKVGSTPSTWLEYPASPRILPRWSLARIVRRAAIPAVARLSPCPRAPVTLPHVRAGKMARLKGLPLTCDPKEKSRSVGTGIRGSDPETHLSVIDPLAFDEGPSRYTTPTSTKISLAMKSVPDGVSELSEVHSSMIHLSSTHRRTRSPADSTSAWYVYVSEKRAETEPSHRALFSAPHLAEKMFVEGVDTKCAAVLLEVYAKDVPDPWSASERQVMLRCPLPSETSRTSKEKSPLWLLLYATV
mmetsp:Transcript_14051/g.20440  ORF Transcript_14051/g.20440 Transcript_14051/m.20440 type:complete len:254 (-) Transcript_14051:1276-2037(-)